MTNHGWVGAVWHRLLKMLFRQAVRCRGTFWSISTLFVCFTEKKSWIGSNQAALPYYHVTFEKSIIATPAFFCETAHAILWDPKYSVCGEESWTFCCRSPITTSLQVLHTRKLFTCSNKLVCYSIGSSGWRKFGIYLNGSSHVINDVTHYSCVNIKCGVVDVN